MLEVSLTALAVGVAAAVKIHDFFEGETLIRDCIDELNLSRTSLSQLDASWSQSEVRSDAIISLTSIPSRLPLIAATLKSLMRQSVAAKKIILNLPRFSQREGIAYDVPPFLADLDAIEVRWCDDLGPATKLLPSLVEPPETKIIVVDDDRIYPANMIQDLVAAADREPNSAFGMSGWIVPDDFTDRPTTVWTNFRKRPPAPIRARRLKAPLQVDILQGASGYLVRPRFFDLQHISNYQKAPIQAFYVDDVWISAHCHAQRFVIPAHRYNYQPKLARDIYRRTSLGLINRGPGPHEARNNTVVIRHLRDRWMASQHSGEQENNLPQ